MKNVKLILGNIEFFSSEGKNQKAIVHEIEALMYFDTVERAERIGEQLTQESVYDSYIIPASYVGEIEGKLIF